MRSQPGQGFSLILKVGVPMNNLPDHDPVYKYYWPKMANNSLIDPQSVKTERSGKFILCSYTAQGQPDVNYFFACQGKWGDGHLSEGIPDSNDAKLLAEFDSSHSYGQ